LNRGDAEAQRRDCGEEIAEKNQLKEVKQVLPKTRPGI
jgi:hypothetical protein